MRKRIGWLLLAGMLVFTGCSSNSEKTVKDGSYALQRPFVMATNGKISEQSKQVQAVFDFINSDDGQKIIKKVGLVTPNK